MEKTPLEPIEAQVVDIILAHPEYHAFLKDPDKFQDKDFSEGNPFLHMSLHMAIREQIQINRPEGIKRTYQGLCERVDALFAEHLMMECLEKILWEAQQNGQMPDEKIYLDCLQRL